MSTETGQSIDKSDDSVLVIQGPAATFNPTIKANVIEKAMAFRMPEPVSGLVNPIPSCAMFPEF